MLGQTDGSDPIRWVIYPMAKFKFLAKLRSIVQSLLKSDQLMASYKASICKIEGLWVKRNAYEGSLNLKVQPIICQSGEMG